MRRPRRAPRSAVPACRGAPQQGAHPGLELGQPERLGQVVVGAVVEADHPVELAGPGGDDHDRAA